MLDVRDFASIVIFTGAGASAESGVATYRGTGGIWAKYDWRNYACQSAFDRDPAKVWEFHNARRTLVASKSPNAFHVAVARLQRSHPQVALITQNIDGLHQRAGSENVIELHGSLWRVRCDRDACRTDVLPPIVLDDPRCESCGGWLRPDITWFGDPLDEGVFDRAARAARSCDLFVSVGVSGVVYPAASIPEIASAAGATCVEINPSETDQSPLYDVRIRQPASIGMREIGLA